MAEQLGSLEKVLRFGEGRRVKRLGQQGLAVVLVSHNLSDVFEVADRITVLRLGRNVGVYEKARTNEQEIVQAITAGTAAASAPA